MGAKVLEKINSYNKEYGDFRYKQAILLMTDAMVFMGAFIISLLVTLGIIYFNNLLFLTMVIISLITFMIIGDYKTLWSTSVDKEVITIFISTVFSTLISYIFINLLGFDYPIAFYIMYGLFTHVGICSIRIVYRGLRRGILYLKAYDNLENRKKVLIIGAGVAGQLILKEMFENPQLNMYPVGIIDDNEDKLGKTYYNVPVIGTTDEIETIAKNLNVEEIIFTIAKIKRKRKREIMQICKNTKCKIKTIPGIYELIDGKVSIKKIRDVNIEDLLGRESRQIKDSEVVDFIKNKKVLVTGAGGSIGSELCRPICDLEPKELILLDMYENNVYEIQQ